MSGRQPEELDRLFKRVPNLGLIAENGCFLKGFGSSKWVEMADPEKMRAWKESVEGIMEYYHARTPGSWIEQRHCSLIFHYKSCEDHETASRQAGDCASHINDACEEQRVRAIPIEGAVAVEPIDWSKGTAAMQIFDSLKKSMAPSADHESPVDFLMVVGDGRDDEVIFRWANELGVDSTVKHVTTVSLGSRNTEAGCTLTQGVTGVLTVLQKLAMLS
jgi:trehalose-phosphatase